jgi:hypothetical protein
MRSQRFVWLLAAAVVLLACTIEAFAQGERFVGVRKDKNDEVILFVIDPLAAAERRVATLHKAGSNIQLLGITTLNARRGTFSYAYSDREAGKEYMHTVSIVSGDTISTIILPADISGMEVVTDNMPQRELQLEREAIRRRVDALEQEVRRLQGQVRR